MNVPPAIYRVTCGKCGHTWAPRKDGGAVRCPRCQAPRKVVVTSSVTDPSYEDMELEPRKDNRHKWPEDRV